MSAQWRFTVAGEMSIALVGVVPRSLSSLLDRQVVPGVESAFRTVLVSVALTTGLLMADVLVPARRAARGNVL